MITFFDIANCSAQPSDIQFGWKLDIVCANTVKLQPKLEFWFGPINYKCWTEKYTESLKNRVKTIQASPEWPDIKNRIIEIENRGKAEIKNRNYGPGVIYDRTEHLNKQTLSNLKSWFKAHNVNDIDVDKLFENAKLEWIATNPDIPRSVLDELSV